MQKLEIMLTLKESCINNSTNIYFVHLKLAFWQLLSTPKLIKLIELYSYLVAESFYIELLLKGCPKATE